MLIEDDAQLRTEVWRAKPFRFSISSRRKSVAVQLQQIERAQDGRRFAAMTTDQLKVRKAAFIANDSLSINQARPNRELADRHSDSIQWLIGHRR